MILIQMNNNNGMYNNVTQQRTMVTMNNYNAKYIAITMNNYNAKYIAITMNNKQNTIMNNDYMITIKQ